MSAMSLSDNIIHLVSQTVHIKSSQVRSVLKLLDEGNTVPFIARYRKEQTGSLDEVQIDTIQKHYHYQLNLEQEKEKIIRTIDDQKKLTPELRIQIESASTLQKLEDLYRPFKPKKQTKAMQAIENGLEPLADWVLKVHTQAEKFADYWQKFRSPEVPDEASARAGVHEIIAQQVADRADFREFIRKYTRYNGYWETKLKEAERDEKETYKLYYDFKSPFREIADHQVLASNRGEKMGVLTIQLTVDHEPALHYLKKHLLNDQFNDDQVTMIENAIEDSYKRFIFPSIQRELRKERTEQADQQAIKLFGDNLRQLLLQPPLKGKIVLGLDPAYRTGCKLAVIDQTGRVLTKSVIYPHPPASKEKRKGAKQDLKQLIEAYQVELIAIGNGTASRESVTFVSEVIRQLDQRVQFIVVNEAGASVYSASEVARQEFPDFQVEERSAVSIARRLQDPLAELIKIDPKSIGIGQYQHDVNQNQLGQALDFVVKMTVNQVGVDVNTASPQLLEHISGMTAATAKNLVALRDEQGSFTSRDQLKKVKRLGPKTFEQAIGFMRILNGENPLDQTSIHPESYSIAEEILSRAGVDRSDLGSDDSICAIKAVDLQGLAEEVNIGKETLSDIVQALLYPLRDIRDLQDAPLLREDVLTLDDLREGMILEGSVRNVVDFGAFVDIGVKEDGLIHISHLYQRDGRFINHPSEVVGIGDIVKVEVVSIDQARGRIGLKQLANHSKKSV